MAEPTCVMHPFSFTTTTTFSDDPPEEKNPMYGIGDSVSFGKYMSDNLEWERWSSFSSNRNRYVEEAEKYSKPGSVKQKKAYFEAHFKRMAALKAAALLEQASYNNASENTSEANVDKSSEEVGRAFSGRDDDDDKENKGIGVVVHQSDLDLVAKEGEMIAENDGGVDLADTVKSGKENEVYSSSSSSSSSVPVKDDACNQSNDDQSCGLTPRDKPPLQKKVSFDQEATASTVKKNPPLSSYMSPTIGGISRAPMLAEPAVGSICAGKENYAATPTRKKSSVSDPDKKRTPLRMSINREINRIISPVIRKIGRTPKDCSSSLNSPAKVSVSSVPESPGMTPSRRERSRLGSSPGDVKAKGLRWQIFSADTSMSPSAARHRISSPIIPSSFCLTGDRASRRKQKLEDKFNAIATERAPQTSKFKEKAEIELNKFRQSFCFKAMASPDHQRDTETLKSVAQKDESTQGNSPKRGRLPSRSTSQSKTSLPPRRPLNKQNGFEDAQQKNCSSGRRTRTTSG